MSRDDDQQPAPKPDGDPDLIKGQVRHKQLSARVPESVARGVFSTGAIVLVGGNEFIIDFVIRMAQPHQVAARVVVPHAVMPQLIGALRTNLDRFRDRFGDPPEMPKGEPGARRPTIEEVYDELKLPDETLSGAYANAVMISHSPAEFCFDFITNFFPKSSVSCRVYVSASQVPRLLDAFSHTYEEFRKRVIAQQQEQQRQVSSPRPIETTESPYYPPKQLEPNENNEQIVGPQDGPIIEADDVGDTDTPHDDTPPASDEPPATPPPDKFG